jgi:hypothetical protein
MDDRFSILSQQVFNKSLNDFSVDELVSITEQNPYFTAAQILLLKKLEKGSEAYNSQYQKAILYYHDPVAFDYLVHRDEFETEAPADELIIENEQVYNNNEISESIATDVEIADNEKNDDVENYMEEMRSGSFAEEEDKTDLERSEQIQLDEITKELSLEEKIDSVNDLSENAQNEIISDHKEPIEESSFSEPESQVLEPDKFVKQPEDKEDILQPDPDKNLDETEQVQVSGGNQNINESIEETEDLSLLKDKELLFEPFHTVDYFASQGIKVTHEETPKDKFGKQLKSFTEWLKTMKRLPAAEIASSVEKSSEQKIENLAADSVSSADVVTEAMAEVWLRQGNEQKAMEIYNKLILLYPSKSAYFAAKIDSLKKSY